MTDTMVEELARLWARHRTNPAPDLSGIETPGSELTVLVAAAEDCVSRYVATGTLDFARTMQLRQSYTQLWAAEQDLPAEAVAWIDELRTLARLVLERTAVQPD
jgi:hypothetical protein